MELKLIRKYPSSDCTIGELYIDGNFECYTCEDVERDIKIPAKTAIPRGEYEVAITFSDKFKKYMPQLLNVPNFTGIRIHPRNTALDTDGCILPGQIKNEHSVGKSVDAYKALFQKLDEASRLEKIFIEITA